MTGSACRARSPRRPASRRPRSPDAQHLDRLGRTCPRASGCAPAPSAGARGRAASRSAVRGRDARPPPPTPRATLGQSLVQSRTIALVEQDAPPARRALSACRARSSAAAEVLERVFVAAQAKPHQAEPLPAAICAVDVRVSGRFSSACLYSSSASRYACRALVRCARSRYRRARLVLEPAARGVERHLRQPRHLGQTVVAPDSSRTRRGGWTRAAAAGTDW